VKAGATAPANLITLSRPVNAGAGAVTRPKTRTKTGS
jgi:hypothetical protein